MVLCVVRDALQHESCYFRQGRAVSTAKQCGAKRPGPLEPQRRFTATAFHSENHVTTSATDENQPSKLATHKSRASNSAMLKMRQKVAYAHGLKFFDDYRLK